MEEMDSLIETTPLDNTEDITPDSWRRGDNIAVNILEILKDIVGKGITCSKISFDLPRRYGKTTSVKLLTEFCLRDFPDKKITIVSKGLKDSFVIKEDQKNRVNIFDNFQELSSDFEKLTETQILLLDEWIPENFLDMIIVSFRTPRS